MTQRPSPDADKPCPENHTQYLSEMLARNAVTLHQIRDPHCPGFQAFPHGDHWHVGHASKVEGAACKAEAKPVRYPGRVIDTRRR